jgi:hypothetical protein
MDTMDPQTVSMAFILLVLSYIIGMSVRTHRQLKNAYEEQYELPASEIQHGDDHRAM